MKTIPLRSAGYAANCYAVICGEDAVIFDPAADAGTVLQTVRAENAAVRSIVLTHGHFDHLLCLEPLRRETGAPVMIHAFDGVCLTDAAKSEFLSFLGRNVTFAPADRFLEDKDVIRVGGEEIRVLHTPGHTAGSCCFLYDHSMITGDTLFDRMVGRTDLFGGSQDALEDSLRTILTLPGDYDLYPGHGGLTTLSRQREINPYLRGVQ